LSNHSLPPFLLNVHPAECPRGRLFLGARLFHKSCKHFIILRHIFVQILAITIDEGEAKIPHPLYESWLLHGFGKALLQSLDNPSGSPLGPGCQERMGKECYSPVPLREGPEGRQQSAHLLIRQAVLSFPLREETGCNPPAPLRYAPQESRFGLKVDA